MGFEGDHTQFRMAEDAAEKGRSCQDFPSTEELGCTGVTTIITITSTIKTSTTQELVLTSAGVTY